MADIEQDPVEAAQQLDLFAETATAASKPRTCRHYRGEGEGRCAHPEAIAAAAKKRHSGRKDSAVIARRKRLP